MEPIFLHDGRLLQVHDLGACAGEHCCIHNPSEHPLSTAPLAWDEELAVMSRICEHGGQHPDPDDLDFNLAMGRFLLVEAIASVHLDRCDGCCHR